MNPRLASQLPPALPIPGVPTRTRAGPAESLHGPAAARVRAARHGARERLAKRTRGRKDADDGASVAQTATGGGYAPKPLNLLEASGRIELPYTDLQSAA